MRRLLLLMLAILVVGCAKAAAQRADPTAPPATPPAAPPGEAAPSPPNDLARRAQIITRVGDVLITVGDVEDQIALQAPAMRRRYRDRAALQELLSNMVRMELLAREAARQGFDRDPEVVDAVAQSAVQQMFRRRFDEELTPETIPQEDVAAYYAAHPDEFNRSELRRASHILVRTREEADRLLPQARAADARAFRTLAQEHSLDAESRVRGGDLRYFDERGQTPNSTATAVDPVLVRATFALETLGDVSDPIEIGGQWSLVKLTGQRPAEHRPLAQATSGIRTQLWRQQREQAIETLIGRVRGATQVETHYERLEPIRIEPPARLSTDPQPHEAAEEPNEHEHEHEHEH